MIINGHAYDLTMEQMREIYWFMKKEYAKEDISATLREGGLQLSEEQIDEAAEIVDTDFQDCDGVWDYYWQIVYDAIAEVSEDT